MDKEIEKKIKILFNEFISIIETDFEKILNHIKPTFIKKTDIISPDSLVTRFQYPQNHSSISFNFVEPDVITSYVFFEIEDLPITQEIFNLISPYCKSPLEEKSFEKDCGKQPSISRNIIAGLITRLYILGGYNIVFSKELKEKAIEEVIRYLNDDNFHYKILINLYGAIGDVDEIKLSDNIFIRSANYEIASLFCLHYFIDDFNYEMYPKDYYISIDRTISKENYYKHPSEDYLIIKNIYNSIVLSGIGNLEIGKILNISDDWPLITTQPISNLLSKTNKYKYDSQFRFSFSKEVHHKLPIIYEKLVSVNFNKVDKKIVLAFDRLKKAKSTFIIEDRIIEMALAIEYLINTQQYEVNLQICLKCIKLYNEYNKDIKLYKTINEFLKLRGNVVHGNKAVESSKENIDTIDRMEEIINSVLLKILDLNKNYSLKEINEAAFMALYVNDTMENILSYKD